MLSKVIAYQVFSFGVIGYNFGANAIFITLLVLPTFMSMVKILFLYGCICIAQKSNLKIKKPGYIKWKDVKTLLFTSPFIFIRICTKQNEDFVTLSGFFEHIIFDIFSFLENLLFTIIGSEFIIDSNFHKTNFSFIVIGTHLLGKAI